MQKNNKSASLIFVALILTCIIPMILAHYLFKNASRLHLATSNHGTLVTPPVPAEQLPFKPFIKQWSLLYQSGSCCDKNCLMNILVTHQVIKSLGVDGSRLRSVVLLPATCSRRPITDTFAKDTVKTDVIFFSPGAAKNNLHLTADQLYIIDPHGNLMMFYKKNYNPLDLYSDLSQLLRVSSIG